MIWGPLPKAENLTKIDTLAPHGRFVMDVMSFRVPFFYVDNFFVNTFFSQTPKFQQTMYFPRKSNGFQGLDLSKIIDFAIDFPLIFHVFSKLPLKTVFRGTGADLARFGYHFRYLGFTKGTLWTPFSFIVSIRSNTLIRGRRTLRDPVFP